MVQNSFIFRSGMGGPPPDSPPPDAGDRVQEGDRVQANEFRSGLQKMVTTQTKHAGMYISGIKHSEEILMMCVCTHGRADETRHYHKKKISLKLTPNNETLLLIFNGHKKM